MTLFHWWKNWNIETKLKSQCLGDIFQVFIHKMYSSSLCVNIYVFLCIIAKVWGPDDGVPAIAIHGLMDNAGSFDLLAPLLPPNIRLVCIELCGKFFFDIWRIYFRDIWIQKDDIWESIYKSTGHGHSSAYPPGVILHYFDHAFHVKLVVDYFKWEKLKVIVIGHRY